MAAADGLVVPGGKSPQAKAKLIARTRRSMMPRMMALRPVGFQGGPEFMMIFPNGPLPRKAIAMFLNETA